MEDELNPTSLSSNEGMGDDFAGDDQNLESTEFEGQGDDAAGEPKQRTAESRINQLIARVKEAESKYKELEEKMAPPLPPAPKATYPNPAQDELLNNPEVQKVATVLKQIGFTTRDEQMKQYEDLTNRMALNNDHQRFESTYNGADGRPKYDRAKVERYMYDNGIGNPEIAYKAMYENELTDWKFKQLEQNKKQKPTMLRSNSGGGNQQASTITREKLQEVMKNPTPQNRLWYERNKGKIQDLIARGQL